ncbi:hypothetical protein [Actinomadura flavalba]|uniref:hypothetical protein n=1 Tax=Actinomadura flavalba TaxID=1120938 RepID=UPI00037ECA4D|nr:hypothetical protein [Actinomadura flavalba]
MKHERRRRTTHGERDPLLVEDATATFAPSYRENAVVFGPRHRRGLTTERFAKPEPSTARTGG